MNTTENFSIRDNLLVSDLANAESEAATKELLAISGLLERVKQNQATPKTEYINWKTVHCDV